MIGKILNVFSIYFCETGIVAVSNYFGWKNPVYASIEGITRESGSYDFAVNTMATTTINLQTFISLLLKLILHVRIVCVTSLQISK